MASIKRTLVLELALFKCIHFKASQGGRYIATIQLVCLLRYSFLLKRIFLAALFQDLSSERLLLNDKMPGFLASGGDEFNLGPETRLDRSELLCNKVLLKYKGDRESF